MPPLYIDNKAPMQKHSRRRLCPRLNAYTVAKTYGSLSLEVQTQAKMIWCLPLWTQLFRVHPRLQIDCDRIGIVSIPNCLSMEKETIHRSTCRPMMPPAPGALSTGGLHLFAAPQWRQIIRRQKPNYALDKGKRGPLLRRGLAF